MQASPPFDSISLRTLLVNMPPGGSTGWTPGDWTAITAEVNEYGGALPPELLTAGETGLWLQR